MKVRFHFYLEQDEAKESKMRIASLVEDVQSTQDRRSALYQSYDDAINKYKSTKEASNFAASRKKIDADYRQLTQQITSLQGQLKTEGSDLAEKVYTVLPSYFVMSVLSLDYEKLKAI